jgi:hypothetical protein
MIQHERTRDGGVVRAGDTETHFTLSHQSSPHCITVHASSKSEHGILFAVCESLCERYSPCVLRLHSNNTRLLYSPKVSRLHRCWNGNGEAVFVEGRENRKTAAEVCALAQAIHSRLLLRQGDGALEFYESRPLLREIRRMTRPLEWSSVYEEFLYETSTAGVHAVHAILEAVDSTRSTIEVSTLREYYAEVSARLNTIQRNNSSVFEGRTACIMETATQVVLPSLLLLAPPHPFRNSVWSAFVGGGSEYITKTTEFINAYGSVISTLQDKNSQ